MSAPGVDSLQRWVAIRRSVSRILGETGAVGAESATGPYDATGLIADFLAELRATSADPLASVRERQRALVSGLQAAGIDIPSSLRPFQPLPDYANQFDDGFEGLIGDGYLRGVRARDGDELSVTGLVQVPATPQGIAIVAESVLTSARQRPERPVLVLLDEASAAVGVDESRSLSEYLVHLARVLAWARSQAVAVNVWLYGGVTAATYAACAASASRVVAFPNAVLLTERSAQAVGSDAASGRQWASVGLVDEYADVGRRAGIVWNASA